MTISINLFKNEYKTDDKHPDYKSGKNDENDGACWIRKDKNGKTYLSVKVSDEKRAAKPKPTLKEAFEDAVQHGSRSDATGYHEADEDLPF